MDRVKGQVLGLGSISDCRVRVWYVAYFLVDTCVCEVVELRERQPPSCISRGTIKSLAKQDLAICSLDDQDDVSQGCWEDGRETCQSNNGGSMRWKVVSQLCDVADSPDLGCGGGK